MFAKYVFHTTPITIKEGGGEYIVLTINEKASQEERTMPWIGGVTKHSQTKVWCDWVIVHEMELKTGMAHPLKYSTSRKSIIGKFSTSGAKTISVFFI